MYKSKKQASFIRPLFLYYAYLLCFAKNINEWKKL